MSIQALAQQLQSQGRGGDTVLAHITPEEAQLLKARGGSGTVNPDTGLPEFGFFSDLWRGFKNAVKKIAPIIMPAIAIFAPALIPAVGTWLGASAATASVVGAAALSAGVTLAAGGDLKQVLTSGALAGLTTFITPIVGNALGGAISSVTGTTLSAGTTSLIGSAAISGGMAAIRGGSVKEVLAAAATGAASNYLTNLASNAVNMVNSAMASGDISAVNQKGLDDAVFLAADAANLKAAGLTEAQIAAALKATGVNSIVAENVAAGISQGKSPENVAFNVAAGSPNGIYGTGKSGQTQSITAGNNLEVLQRAEDALMVAEDATRLQAQGLSAAQIKENLMATGVSEAVANTAANNAGRTNAAGLANTLQSSYASAGKNLFGSTENVVGRDLGEVMTAEQTEAYRALPYKASIDSGAITASDANVLKANGYTPDQVASLTTAGYSGADLVDLASTGVTAATLTTMSNTRIPENSINDLFRAGASANDIASVSRNLIDTGRLSVASATNILARDFDYNAIDNLVTKGIDVDAVANSGLKPSTISTMQNYGINVDNVLNAIENGTYTADGVNEYATNRNLNALGAVSTAGAVTAVAPGGNTTTTTGSTTTGGTTNVTTAPVDPGDLGTTTGSFGSEASFLAQDAAYLHAQGLSTAQIKTALLASGASEAAAVYGSTYAGYGYTADQIQSTLNQYHSSVDLYPTVTSTTTAGTGTTTVDPFASLKAIAADFKGSGVPPDALQEYLVSNGMPADQASVISGYTAPAATGTTTVDPYANIKSTAVQLKGYGWTAEDLQNWMTSAGVPADQATAISGYTAPAAVAPTDTAGTGTTTTGTTTTDTSSNIANLNSYGQGDTPGQVSRGTDGIDYLTLDNGKVVRLDQFQAALDSGLPISIDGQVNTQFRVEATGVPKYSGMQGTGTPPPGFQVAKPGDVFGPADTNNAANPFKPGTYLDPETNTWFTPTSPAAIPPTLDSTVATTPESGTGVGSSTGTGTGGMGTGSGTGTSDIDNLGSGAGTAGTGTGASTTPVETRPDWLPADAQSVTLPDGRPGFSWGSQVTDINGRYQGTPAGVFGTITPIIPGGSTPGVVTGPATPTVTTGGTTGGTTSTTGGTTGGTITTDTTGTTGGTTTGTTGGTTTGTTTTDTTGTGGVIGGTTGTTTTANTVTGGTTTGTTGGTTGGTTTTDTTGGTTTAVGNVVTGGTTTGTTDTTGGTTGTTTANVVTGGTTTGVTTTDTTGGTGAVVPTDSTGNVITSVITPVIPGGSTVTSTNANTATTGGNVVITSTGNVVGTGGNAVVVGNTGGTGGNAVVVGNTGGTGGNVITIGTGGNGNANIGNIGGTGNTTGNVTGNITGNVTGNITGNVTGNTTGNVVGNTTGNVTGNTSVTGNVIVPVTPIIPGDDTTWTPTPYTPLTFKTLPDLKLPGLNPGFIAPEPYYQNTNQVQSRYYWGSHPYQPGPTFNQALYNQVPAPVTPWGLQQMYTPTDLAKYFADQQVTGPVVPR